MSVQWKEQRFGNLLIGGTRNGIYKQKQWHGRGQKIVNMGELFAHSRLASIEMKRVELTDKEKEKSLLLKGDLIFARRSLTAEGAGKCAIIMDIDEDTTFESSIIRARLDQTRCDPLFYYYFFSSSRGKYLLGTILRQVAVSGITGTDLVELPVPVPNLGEQTRLSEIFGVLDDKIENNRRMNETLEEMARAIFKSWFVDFDPVHAKAAGNAPAHMDAETAALFPSSFSDDGLPIGFNSKTLKDGDTELESGKRPKGGIDKSLHEGIPSIGAESLQKIGDFEYSKVKFVGKEFAEKSSKGWVQNYDVAIYKDGANVGDPTRVGLFGNGFPFDRFMVNEHVFLLRSKELGQPFLYSLCQSEMLSHQLKSMGTSKAAQPGLNQQEVLSCEYIAPPQALISAFNKLISPLIDRRLCLGLENQTLAELRDTLLPKLMSGEIRVADAEREVEANV
jgi:type I restriction enzyme, S subunit